MREILFRAKRIDNGELIEGFYAKSGDRTFILIDNDFAVGYVIMKEVYPETVGEYTGLTDKNGKKIFEGDIIKDKELPGIYMIGYKEDSMKYAFLYYHKELKNIYCGGFVSKEDGKSIEVIGNIHDNPELLGVKE